MATCLSKAIMVYSFGFVVCSSVVDSWKFEKTHEGVAGGERALNSKAVYGFCRRPMADRALNRGH